MESTASSKIDRADARADFLYRDFVTHIDVCDDCRDDNPPGNPCSRGNAKFWAWTRAEEALDNARRAFLAALRSAT